MRRRILPLLCTFLVLAMIASACGQSKNTYNSSGISSKSGLKKLTIVTSFYPVYISTLNITKDIPGIQVTNMTKPQTGCLHDYQLSPDDLKTLENADIFVVNGAGMESFMDKVIKQQPHLKVVEASKSIELIKAQGKDEFNPHVWLSISNAILQVQNIKEQLERFDPANASQYKSNADTYIKALEAEKDKMHKVLDKIKNKDIITFHEAFPYFAKEFGLNIAAVIEREPGTEPSPKELENTIRIVKDLKTKALFAEPQYSSRAADTIARETGAKVYTLDPGVTGELTPGAYIDMMEQNLKTLEEALS